MKSNGKYILARKGPMPDGIKRRIKREALSFHGRENQCLPQRKEKEWTEQRLLIILLKVTLELEEARER